MGLRDRFNQMTGKTQFVVARIFLQLSGSEVNPLLGTLNQAARQAIESDGDLTVVGECLTEVCQNLLQYDTYWRSGHNEGDVFWDEGEAGDYFNSLFTDAAQRYLSEADYSSEDPNRQISAPATQNVVVMMTIAYEGQDSNIETNLADMSAMRIGLKSIINLHYNDRLRAIQLHYSPARFSDILTDDQVLLNFPELIPL
jgi:uncharacterized membrane protein